MRRRNFIAMIGSTSVALTGCLDFNEGDSERSPGSTGTPVNTPTPTDAATEPTYTTCESEPISVAVPQSASELPDTLTRESVAAYVEAVEREFVLPSDTDGYVVLGDVTVESVAHGYLARVPVNGGYYNEAAGANATETIHYDLGTHTASYFVAEQLVRRATTRGQQTPVDPRTRGDLIVCTET